jgi:beta-alanine--pyruvate transaminase
MKRQIDTLDYASSFQVGHAGAFELAERIAALAPPGLDRVFLVNSGSEAVDTALKIALAYARARGAGSAACSSAASARSTASASAASRWAA